jgi:hypothetical protein
MEILSILRYTCKIVLLTEKGFQNYMGRPFYVRFTMVYHCLFKVNTVR